VKRRAKKDAKRRRQLHIARNRKPRFGTVTGWRYYPTGDAARRFFELVFRPFLEST
jgi:hypothetical protein